MENNQKTTSGAIGLFGLLTVLFVGLKLCHVIDWSWWWVLAPVWIPLGIAVLVIIVGLIITVIAAARS